MRVKQEILMAEKWARMNKLPFPKIDPKVFDREGLKECYVFKPKKGEKNCPTVIHFVLVNINFRKFKAPGTCALQVCGVSTPCVRGKICQESQCDDGVVPPGHMRHLFLEITPEFSHV